MTCPRRISFTGIWLCSLLVPSLGSPLNAYNTANVTDSPAIAGPSSLATQDAHGAGLMVSWLWGLVWGDDSTVSVVDRTPVLNFNARPAAFGPASDVLGYLIRVEDFSVPCDEDEDGVEHHGHGPWWPGGGSEWETESSVAPDGAAERRREEAEKRAEHDWKLEARYGCPRLCVRGKDKPQSSETWMALVMRGGCTFVEKVREAQRFGAKGVVVGGETKAQDQHGDGLVQMFSLGISVCHDYP
jgi:PA domain